MMDETGKLLVEINKSIGELSGKLQMALDKLVQHEGRITRLESGGASFKDDMMKLLVKALTISVVTIASLTGAGALLKNILNF